MARSAGSSDSSNAWSLIPPTATGAIAEVVSGRGCTTGDAVELGKAEGAADGRAGEVAATLRAGAGAAVRCGAGRD
ncbi:MAG: hypothetical protein ACO1OX_07295 [Novosphingobium sp.]